MKKQITIVVIATRSIPLADGLEALLKGDSEDYGTCCAKD